MTWEPNCKAKIAIIAEKSIPPKGGIKDRNRLR
jgi:hypothetical protein